MRLLVASVLASSLVLAPYQTTVRAARGLPATTTDYTQYVNAYQGGQVYMKYPLGRLGLWSTAMGETPDSVTRGLVVYPTVDQTALRTSGGDWRSSVQASPSESTITYGSGTPAKGSTSAMTLTPNVAFYQLHFNSPASFGAVDMELQNIESNTITWGQSTWTEVDPQTAVVHLTDGSATYNFYYYLHFSVPATSFGTFTGSGSTPGAKTITGQGGGGYFAFAPGTDVTVTAALSMTSAATAQKNYQTEAAPISFAQAVANLRAAWNAKLSKVDSVQASALTTQKVYTALYTAYANIYDVTDNSPGYAPVAPSTRLLTAGSSPHYEHLGDGYMRGEFDMGRDFYALMALIDPAVDTDLLNTYISQYNRDGYLLGNWDVYSGTAYWGDQQWGYFDQDFSRAKLMGVGGVDYNKAEQAILATEGKAATARWASSIGYYTYGYAPADKTINYMSRGMEMSTHLSGLAHLAAANGDTATYNTYISHQGDYANTFNPASQNLQGRCTAASVSPCDSGNWAPPDGGFFEGDHNSYAFDEPQDGIGLAKLYGDSAMVSRLTSELSGCGTGCAFGWNDYAVYQPYLAAAANDPALAQSIIRNTFLPGFNSLNMWENNGGGTPFYTDNAASSLLGELGIFPLQSPAAQWMLNSPEVTTAVVHGTRDVTISAPNNSSSNIYVNSLQVNGAAYPSHYISGETLIAQPTTITFGMTSSPSRIGPVYVTGTDGEILSAVSDNTTYLQFNNDPVGGTSRARIYSTMAPTSVSANGTPVPFSYNSSEQLIDVSGLGAGTVRVSFGSQPSITQVQSMANLGRGTSLSFTATVNAGDLLVGLFRSNGTITSVSDSLNGAWTEAVGNSHTGIWYRPATKAGTATVTVASSPGVLRAAFGEYSGAATFVSGACAKGFGPAIATGPTAAVGGGDLVFAGVAAASNPATVVAGASDGVAATIRQQATGSDGTVASEDVTSSAAGVQNASMTLSPAGGWHACAAVFR